MADCNTCPTKGTCNSKEKCTYENNPLNNVKKVIAVMSGKGGVGKSTVSALIAKSLAEKGNKVGILDADITGPSIPRLLKISDQRAYGNEQGIIPVKSDEGISVISLNLMTEDEEQPVLWRGPMISGAVKQFWTEVLWGELDYLIIDMPPGTGDIALTVMQTIPINGIVMVTTPQDMVSMIVSKAVNMVKTMNVPLIGIIENMSYIICPKCQDKITMFEDQNTNDFYQKSNIKLLAQLPMCREVAAISGTSLKIKDETVNDLIKKTIDEVTKTIAKSV